ncbi:MAG: hypothetical protein FWC79_05725 [Oscillospiraceae bacterium]|nr:hypothetical protein [Oscillospiraceae bacterium]
MKKIILVLVGFLVIIAILLLGVAIGRNFPGDTYNSNIQNPPNIIENQETIQSWEGEGLPPISIEWINDLDPTIRTGGTAIIVTEVPLREFKYLRGAEVLQSLEVLMPENPLEVEFYGVATGLSYFRFSFVDARGTTRVFRIWPNDGYPDEGPPTRIGITEIILPTKNPIIRSNTWELGEPVPNEWE